MYIISKHAQNRIFEYCPQINIHEELKNAVPFGGQRHGDTSLLLPCNYVAIINKENVMITLLKYEYALANMQANLNNVSTVSKNMIKNIAKDVHATIESSNVTEFAKNLLEYVLNGDKEILGKDYQSQIIEIKENSPKGFSKKVSKEYQRMFLEYLKNQRLDIY